MVDPRVSIVPKPGTHVKHPIGQIDSLDSPDRPETEDSIRLKARLLHQVSETKIYAPLEVFQTTVKERMEIIARDRNRIKTRKLATSVRRQSESLSNYSYDISFET